MNSQGQASVTWTFASVGAHVITASYAGVNPYNGSQGAINLTVAVAGWTPLGAHAFVVGADAGGGPHVQVFSAAGTLLDSYFAYDVGFHGGIDRLFVASASCRARGLTSSNVSRLNAVRPGR